MLCEARLWLAKTGRCATRRTKVDWAQEVEEVLTTIDYASAREGEILVSDQSETTHKRRLYEAFEQERARSLVAELEPFATAQARQVG